MRRSVVAVLVMAGMGLVGNTACAQRGGSERQAVQNGWTFSLEAGKRQARATGKPLMVVIRCVP
jgi:hypothetical protein